MERVEQVSVSDDGINATRWIFFFGVEGVRRVNGINQEPVKRA